MNSEPGYDISESHFGDPVEQGIVNVHQLEALAQPRVAEKIWDYVAGGSEDEVTLRMQPAAWTQIQLAPHNLVDVSVIDTSTELFGIPLDHPIGLAPTARHATYFEGGEASTIAGAKAAGALYIQSSLGSTKLDDVGAAAREHDQPWLFQLYIQQDRGFTRDLVARAESNGAKAMVLTVDTPSLGARDRDKRDNLGAPDGEMYPILDGSPLRPDPTPIHRRIYNPHLSPNITWDDFADLVSYSNVPVVPKGVIRADDAKRFVDAGAAAIYVSNHGARNLDTVATTAQALPRIVDAVDGRVPVLVDGGIRRGTSIAKALAIGATMVFVGRPYVWGLASFGPRGVQHVVEMLQTELEMAMALLGAPTLADLNPDLLWRD